MNFYLISVFLFALASIMQAADASQDLDGRPALPPRRQKRSLSNYYDCPPSWINPPPGLPPLPCPPGTWRPPLPHGIPARPLTPCPPWVDDEDFCHIADRRFSGDRCGHFYGPVLFAEWRRNARRIPPPGPQTTPTPCVPLP